MTVIICNKCDKRVEMKKLGDKYVSLTIYERKKVYDSDDNYSIYPGTDLCYDCFEEFQIS